MSRNQTKNITKCYGLLLGAALFVLPTKIAQAAGPIKISIVPYAGVSSTKSIKPQKVTPIGQKDTKTSSSEKTTQRQNVGVKVDVKIFKLFGLNVTGGYNKINTTKKAAAMRDEFEEIDFNKDLGIGTSTADFIYEEEQRMGTVKLGLYPGIGKLLNLKAEAGVRARQRLIKSENKLTGEVKEVNDPIRFHPTASAGIAVKLGGMAQFMVDYSFYFLKFPETNPHEQEVSIGMGVAL
jgi:hypothetical protein